jgi:Ni,Fe-hydrogenase III large subunit/Ni,Fe-hydrogenase III component G
MSPHQTWIDRSTPLPGSPGVRHLHVALDSWRRVALDLAAADGRLLALWADAQPAPTVHAAFLGDTATLVSTLELPVSEATCPSLADIYPAALRMQRAAADLSGVRASDGDARPWLRHAAWPADYLPLANLPDFRTEPQQVADQYPFVRVTGDGVHEIPVGPVHAGIIEPGHFRFSVVGEKVLKLEARLGYAHKGIEQRFAQMRLADGHRLAARVSGDSAVAYAWAYCQALEGIAGTVVPARAQWLRALALESERIANHLGDLGALGNDAGFAFGLAQFSRLKETWLRALHAAFGQRYLLDYVVPGGVQRDPAPPTVRALVECAQQIRDTTAEIRSIYDEHAGVRDRFVGAGAVASELAKQLGLIGLAGRASGQDYDLRVDLPCAPYGELEVRKALRTDGDVAARVAVRFDELAESVRLVEEVVARLPAGACVAELAATSDSAFGVGLVEGWRGPVMIALTADADGMIRRCHPHDPSWQNWPVLEHAIIGNIVPDFPLINKSFNLSYSGHDL